MAKTITPPDQSHRLVNTALQLLVVAIIVLACGSGASSEACGQEPEKKKSPVTAEEPRLTPQEHIEQLQKRVAQLGAEVSRLRAELAKLEKYRQIDYTRGLIRNEEDRIRGLQSELSDIAARETPLNKRLDEIEKELRPERIERNMAGVGSTRPDEERSAIIRQFTNEKRLIQAQLETLRSNRARIPALIANAESSITRLKQRLAELSR